MLDEWHENSPVSTFRYWRRICLHYHVRAEKKLIARIMASSSVPRIDRSKLSCKQNERVSGLTRNQRPRASHPSQVISLYPFQRLMNNSEWKSSSFYCLNMSQFTWFLSSNHIQGSDVPLRVFPPNVCPFQRIRPFWRYLYHIRYLLLAALTDCENKNDVLVARLCFSSVECYTLAITTVC